MFGKDDGSGRSGSRNAPGETTLSIVAHGTTITGDIDCAGVLKVEGRIDGQVLRARQVMIAKDGQVHGDVRGQEVMVGGLIEGNVVAGDRLELQTTAIVNGDITTKSVIVMEGARINGVVKMSDLPGAASGFGAAKSGSVEASIP